MIYCTEPSNLRRRVAWIVSASVFAFPVQSFEARSQTDCSPSMQMGKPMLSSCCLKAVTPGETHVAYVQRKIEEQDCIVQAALSGDPTADAAYLNFFLGTGDPTEFSQLRKHALQGYAAAQYRLSSLLTTSERLYWLRKAATGGWPEAQFWLGLSYLDPQQHNAAGKYLTRDGAQALNWFKTLAANTKEVGLARRRQAHGLIANLYLQGDVIPMDHAEAFRWASEGAKNGDYASARVLARVYADGLGVERDSEKAEFWSARSRPPAIP